MKGLTPKTQAVFDNLSSLECLKPYVLVGGTALSLQINTRQSEDLDFMKWRSRKDEKMEVAWPEIRRQLQSVGPVESIDVYDFDHVEFIVSGVKISFYATTRNRPQMSVKNIMNNIDVADIESIGVMKMETMLRRSLFRDYYDIYSILKEGCNIHRMISNAVLHSEYQLKKKNLIAILSNGQRFTKDANFSQLLPKYDVTANEIELYIKTEYVIETYSRIRKHRRKISFYTS